MLGEQLMICATRNGPTPITEGSLTKSEKHFMRSVNELKAFVSEIIHESSKNTNNIRCF